MEVNPFKGRGNRQHHELFRGKQMEKIIVALLLMTSLINASEYRGIVVPIARLNLSSESNGHIIQMVEVGDRLKKEEPLLSLRKDVITLSGDKIKQEMITFQQEIDYYLKLKGKKEEQLKKGLISSEELASISHELNRASRKLLTLKIEESKLSIEASRRVILAPFAGIVTKSYKKIHEYASTGEVALEIVDDRQIYVVFTLDAPLAILHKSVAIKGLSKDVILARIDWVAPEIDAATNLIEVKVILQNTADFKMKPGARCTVELTHE
ncbi:MAG: efflux RND transporter periplasmic adaptor subunit [Lentisphaeraceae bacterium]|nr:efflux RND transporter periplasmic adaptor subunit [Lentisphaeraceae bacterium]